MSKKKNVVRARLGLEGRDPKGNPKLEVVEDAKNSSYDASVKRYNLVPAQGNGSGLSLKDPIKDKKLDK